ncbi:28S ribosomal protein S7, mitochondrial-like isoform X1 [Asterias rubens]|uniref:28S ribosomal protein S7, mitochondrial-like isoform X1 n=1 Tax=Asterias rubens TaxID=7604 RepID=UPI0014558725|nr:28S ribosomal protein S7, mitochondrial-like isoform X1 [Asterias rubens]
MALPMRVCRAVLNLSISEAKYGIWLPGFIQVRHSRYPATHVRPKVNRKAYEDDTLPFDISTPVKAAKCDSSSSSLLHDPLIKKFVNIMNKKGKKETVRKIMNETLEKIKIDQLQKYNKALEAEKSSVETNPRVIFYKAIENCKPLMGLAVVKKGGKNYQVPTPLTPSRQTFLAMKWLLHECHTKSLKVHMPDKLSLELLDAFNNQGQVIKRKHDLHKQCEANRAYAHFRWW